MTTEELTDAQRLEYFINHFQFYDTVKILSYTPCLFLMEEPCVDIKRKYADALLRRCYSGKGETIIYASESGLKSITSRNQESIKSNFEMWDDLLKISKEHPKNLRINIVRDEFLPCVSFILGRVPKEPWGSRAPWDLLVEYRVGMTPDQLFKTGVKETSPSHYEIKLASSELPEGISWILDRLEIQSSVQDFEKWIKASGIKHVLAPPQIAVLSAIPKEVQYYRRGLTSKLVDYSEGSQLGQIKVQNNNHTIVFPTTNYGRYKTFEKIASLCNQFKDITTCIFMGCAGGNPAKVNFGDVVISSEIIELVHEKVLLKNEIEKMKGLRISGELIDISSEAEIELRVESHVVNRELRNSAKGLSDKTSQANWPALVKKYLNFCPDSGGKEKLLLNPPKIILDKIWSSDHNVNDVSLRNMLSRRFEVAAFEMEGGGFAEGAKAFGKRFIEIRGISDDADGNRDDTTRQPLAIAIASACAEALIIDILAHNIENKL